MADAGSPSPFRRHSDDTTPIQRKVTHDYITRVREAMRRVMEELNIPPPEPHSGAVWAAAINLMYCSISLNELTPERMHAYGPLNAQAADRLDRIRAELDGFVAKLRRFLGKGLAAICNGGYSNSERRVTRFGCSVKSKGSSPRMVS